MGTERNVKVLIVEENGSELEEQTEMDYLPELMPFSDIDFSATDAKSAIKESSYKNAHGSRHNPDGADPIAVGTPAAIGTANSAGSANSVSRSDHVHNHGNQTNENHHALATNSAHGFMPKTDKAKLDNLKTKSGVVANTSFSGNPKKYTVTFSTNFPDTDYSIRIVGVDSRSWTYESKSNSGFVINTNANQALTGEVSWGASYNGELV